jgi:hypothetical protein
VAVSRAGTAAAGFAEAHAVDAGESLQKQDPGLQETAADAKSSAGIAVIKAAAGVLQVPQEWGRRRQRTTGPDSWAHKCLHQTWLQLRVPEKGQTGNKQTKKDEQNNRKRGPSHSADL